MQVRLCVSKKAPPLHGLNRVNQLKKSNKSRRRPARCKILSKLCSFVNDESQTQFMFRLIQF